MDKQRIKEFEYEHRELTCKWNELSKYIDTAENKEELHKELSNISKQLFYIEKAFTQLNK